MATIGSLRIGLSAGTEQLKRDLNEGAAAVNTFASRVERGLTSGLVAGADAAVSLAAGLARAAGQAAALGAVVGAGIAVVGIVKATKAASDLTEQTSKAGAVFGSSASTITDEADRMAARFGVAKKEFIEGATSLGQLGKAATGSAAKGAEFGARFAKLAIDLASFNNVPIEEALVNLRSGLAGEAEPLRRFGVFLNEAAVEQEAMRLGLVRSKSELTDYIKIQARASLILKQTTDQQGDQERTFGQFAAQLKAVAGRVENLFADLGKAIEPATSAVTVLANSALAALGDAFARNRAALGDWAKDAASGTGLIVEAFARVGEGIGALADGLQWATRGWLVLKVEALAAYGAIVKALARLGLAEEAVADAMIADARKAGQELQADFLKAPPSAGIKELLDDVRKRARAATEAAAQLGGAPKKAFEGLADKAADLGGKVKEVVEHLKEQVATFGLGAGAADLYKLRLKGATDADLAEATALQAKLQALHDEKKAREKDQHDARHLVEASRSPLEEFRDEVGKIRALATQGLLTAGQAFRGVIHAGKELGQHDQPRSAPAFEQGSKEARSAVLQFQQRGGRQEEIRRIAEGIARQVAEQKVQTGLLRTMAGSLAPVTKQAPAL
jgi:hypothetical protein